MATLTSTYITNLNTSIANNNTSLPSIITSVNAGYATTNSANSDPTLTDRMNQEILLNNVNQEILLKQEKILALKNAKLNGQLIKLNDLQGSIINKDTLVRQTDEELKNKNNNISFLTIAIILAIICFGIIGLSYLGKIDNGQMRYSLITLAIIAIIVYIYYSDLFYLRTSFKSIFYDREQIMINKLNELSDYTPGDLAKKGIYTVGSGIKYGFESIENSIQESIYGSQADWQKANCQASDGSACNNNGDNNGNDDTSQGGNNNQNPPGYFYYDKSAPPQQLYPPVTYRVDDPTKDSDDNRAIFWPDFDGSNQKDGQRPVLDTTENPDRYEVNNNPIDSKLTGSYTLTTTF